MPRRLLMSRGFARRRAWAVADVPVPDEVWRVVERRPGEWFAEVVPWKWFGRFSQHYTPVRCVGGLDECLGLALHCAWLGHLEGVTVWPFAGRPYVVEVSAEWPKAMPAALQAME